MASRCRASCGNPITSKDVYPIMKKLGLIALVLASLLDFGQAAGGQTPAETEQATPSPTSGTAPIRLKPDANGKLSQEQMQQLFRVVADKDIENDKRLRNYTYIERDEERKVDGKGDVKSVDVTTYEVMDLYGEQVQRLIAKDDKPLDAEDSAKEEKKIQKIIDKRKSESE